MLDRANTSISTDGLCPPECPPPSDNLAPDPDVREARIPLDSGVGLHSLTETPTTLYAVDSGRSCDSKLETLTQSAAPIMLPLPPPSLPVLVVGEYGPCLPPDDRQPSRLPDTLELPCCTASLTALETIPAWSPEEVGKLEAEAFESVVLLLAPDLSDLPNFPSGIVSWSRSLSQEVGTLDVS